MKKLIVIALLTTTSVAQAEDLLEVYAQARTADPTLSIADAQRGISHEQAVQARAVLLPQWSLQAQQTHQQTGALPGQQDGHLYSSSLSQTLLDLGALRSYDAASSMADAQDQSYRAAEADLCARVAAAYFGVLGAQAALQTAQANEAAFTTQVQQAQARFDAGLSAQVDVEQSRTYLELARGATLQASQDLADAREALAEITGHAPSTLRPLATELAAVPPSPQDAKAWVARALEANPTLRAGGLQLQASEQRVGAARAGNLPTLALTLNHQRGTGPYALNEPGTQGQIGLQLSIPLFAGGATQSAVHQAALQRDTQRDTLEVARRALMRETQAQYQAVLTGVALLQSTQAAEAAADRGLQSTRSGVELGTRTTTDLLLAIQNQAAARLAHEQARTRYVLATLGLRQAAGSLGEPELATVNDWLDAGVPTGERKGN